MLRSSSNGATEMGHSDAPPPKPDMMVVERRLTPSSGRLGAERVAGSGLGRGQQPRDGVGRRSHHSCQGTNRFLSRGNGIISRT